MSGNEKSKNKRNPEMSSDQNNPCVKEHKLAMKCSMVNMDDKDRCKAYFSNYRTCMEFWTNVKADRRTQRIRPVLPPPEEREKIKEEYMKKRMSS